MNPAPILGGMRNVVARMAAGWQARFSTPHAAMLRAARRAPLLLGDSVPLVRGFLLERQNSDGGFQGRTPGSDLYYTAFALDSLLALGEREALKAGGTYLASFGDGDGLDLVHLCSLARGHGTLRGGGLRPKAGAAFRKALTRQIEAYRSSDGGYHSVRGQSHGTAYAAFLALGACLDMGFLPPRARSLTGALRSLQSPDGLWANERPAAVAGTNPTAAALAVLVRVGGRVDKRRAAEWFMAQAHPLGGFCASPLTPIPDLLSTATALHTLAALGAPVAPIRRQCLDFIDSLWSNRGSFHAHWQEDELDVEYTFYGLLALGHLSQRSRHEISPFQG